MSVFLCALHCPSPAQIASALAAERDRMSAFYADPSTFSQLGSHQQAWVALAALSAVFAALFLALAARRLAGRARGASAPARFEITYALVSLALSALPFALGR